MSTLPILDYGASAESAGAGDAGAPGQPAAVPENAVPTDGAAFAREAAIVPPEGADDLVSRAQWQWAIGESEAARGAKGASPAGDASATSPGTTKKRPTPRSRASPPVPGNAPGKAERDVVALPRPGAERLASSQTSRRAAETAIARVEVEEARAKLAVVERLLEDEPVRRADAERARGETSSAGGEKNGEEALAALRRLVAPLTGEEFMRACEERCLAGKCGWPLCGVKTPAFRGSNAGEDDDASDAAARAARRLVVSPDGSAGSVRGGRGAYRIDAVRRKVYRRGDLEMFCGDAHRNEAEAMGVSLALPLDPVAEAERAEPDRDAGDARASAAAKTKTIRSTALDAKARAMGDANANVKADVPERRPPAVVERRAPDGRKAEKAPRAASIEGGGEKRAAAAAAAAVEGYVPRRAGGGSAKPRQKQKQKRDPPPSSNRGQHRSADPNEAEPPLTGGPDGEKASPLGARALDLQLEKAARADDSTLAPRGDASENAATTPPGATFFFDVFAEGLEKAEKGANIMGSFSEGQLSRVVPEAALPGPGPEASGDDGDGEDDEASGERGADAAVAAVAAATAAAARAAETGGAAAEEALAKAREALKATLTKVGASGDDRNGDDEDKDEDNDSRASGDSDSDDALVALAPGAVSEFGTTWMMLDGWVTRATFAYVSADDARASSRPNRGSSPNAPNSEEGGSDPEPSGLPPRLGYAKQMSDAAASELRRALPSVRAALGIRASVLSLERSLGELMRTFFFDASIPGLRRERWALLVAAMLERGVAARAAAVTRKENASSRSVPHIAEDVAAARRDGGPLWALVAAAGASKEEYDAYGDLIAGECAKSW